MRIGINALYWRPNSMGGTQTYFLNLMKHLVKAAPEDQFTLFLNADAASHYRLHSPNLTVHAAPVSGRNRVLRLAWENIVLPKEAVHYDLDVMHSLGYMSPPVMPIPSIVTVLDMIHFIRPKNIDLAKRLLWKVLFPLSLRRVSEIITISQSVKDDLVSVFPWTAKKITPIHLAVDHEHFVAGNNGGTNSLDTSLQSPYILAVSSLAPHKNLDSVITAFSLVASQVPDLRLILVGMRSTAAEELIALAHQTGIKERIEFTGRVPESELILFYQNAAVFVYPSLYEGFGLPVLEAMACGCPVITSNCHSMPEIAGEAALLIDPTDIRQLASCIAMLINSSQLRTVMADKGIRRAAQFNWIQTAKETLHVYHSHIHAFHHYPNELP